MGGQNFASNWSDGEEDLQDRARNIPVGFGFHGALIIIIFLLVPTAPSSFLRCWFIPNPLSTAYVFGAFWVGLYFLLLPAYRLYKTKASPEAANLFSRASCYPAVISASDV
ncbi:MAG: hypothetical protein OS130_14270 [Thermodesulfobacteriota bacterium]|jgi:hypothetical protein|nr:MAG: hypothetical protein OS130_14270 [Thermodesulfobacteriota bacterium]